MAPLRAISAFGGDGFGHRGPAWRFAVRDEGSGLGPLMALVGGFGVAEGFDVTGVRVDEAEADVGEMGVADDSVARRAGGDVPGAELANGAGFAGVKTDFQQSTMPVRQDHAIGRTEEGFVDVPRIALVGKESAILGAVDPQGPQSRIRRVGGIDEQLGVGRVELGMVERAGAVENDRRFRAIGTENEETGFPTRRDETASKFATPVYGHFTEAAAGFRSDLCGRPIR